MILERLIAPLFDANTYILAAERGNKALIVDPGHGHVDSIFDTLERFDLSVGGALLTHGHPDHIWDCAAVAAGPDGKSDAPVWIAGSDEVWMNDPLAGSHPIISLLRTQIATEYERPKLLETLGSHAASSAIELVPGVYVRMVLAPGHTDGSALFLWVGDICEGNMADAVQRIASLTRDSSAGDETMQHTDNNEEAHERLFAFTGDVLFRGSVGRTDLPMGDHRMMLHTLRTLCNIIDPATILFPGHGELTVMADEIKTNPYLKQARYQG